MQTRDSGNRYETPTISMHRSTLPMPTTHIPPRTHRSGPERVSNRRIWYLPSHRWSCGNRYGKFASTPSPGIPLQPAPEGLSTINSPGFQTRGHGPPAIARRFEPGFLSNQPRRGFPPSIARVFKPGVCSNTPDGEYPAATRRRPPRRNGVTMRNQPRRVRHVWCS